MVVYPRWRGELNIGNGFAAAASGLSPLARGTRQNGLSSLVRLRFIPAGAGNTCFRKSMDYCYSVYPRWRGEHTRPYQIAVIYLRFIPAGAGNT